MSAAARAISARATGESVEKIGIAEVRLASACPSALVARSEKCGRLVWGRSPLCQAADAAKRGTRRFDAPPGVDPSEAKKAAEGRPSRIGNALSAASGSDRLRPRAATAGKAETQEAERHHRPSRWLRNWRRKPLDFVEKFVADNLVHVGRRMAIVVIEIGIRRRAQHQRGDSCRRRSCWLSRIVTGCRECSRSPGPNCSD